MKTSEIKVGEHYHCGLTDSMYASNHAAVRDGLNAPHPDPWQVEVIAVREPRELDGRGTYEEGPIGDSVWVPKVAWDGVRVRCIETDYECVVSSREVLAPWGEAARELADKERYDEQIEAHANALDEHARVRHEMNVRAIEATGGDAELLYVGTEQVSDHTRYTFTPEQLLRLLQSMQLAEAGIDAHLTLPPKPMHPSEIKRLAKEFARDPKARDQDLRDMACAAAVVREAQERTDTENAERIAAGLGSVLAGGLPSFIITGLLERRWGMSGARAKRALSRLDSDGHAYTRAGNMWHLTDTGRSLVDMFEIKIPQQP